MTNEFDRLFSAIAKHLQDTRRVPKKEPAIIPTAAELEMQFIGKERGAVGRDIEEEVKAELKRFTDWCQQMQDDFPTIAKQISLDSITRRTKRNHEEYARMAELPQPDSNKAELNRKAAEYWDIRTQIAERTAREYRKRHQGL